jgi:two-component system, NarL family, invasion response regulator UvrY
MIRALVVDDHPVVRQGIKQILSATPDIVVAGEAASSAETLEQVRLQSFDLVLLDISMPGVSGIETLRQLRIKAPELPVLILSIHSEDEYAVRVLRAGAAGFLSKDSAPHELVNAIRRVASGRKYVTTSLAENLADRVSRADPAAGHEALSGREHEVLCLIASGRSVKQIAEALCLSIKTVSTYRARILQKMGMASNAELTRYAIKHDLID